MATQHDAEASHEVEDSPQMQDLVLSPLNDNHDDASDAGAADDSSLIPLSMTDSASGERPLPSLHGPITYRDLPFIGAFVLHLLLLLIVTNAIRSQEDDEEFVSKNDPDDEAKLSAGDIGIALRSLGVVNILFSVGWLVFFIFCAKMRFVLGSCAFSLVSLTVLAITLLLLDSSNAAFFGVLMLCAVAADANWMYKSKNGFDFVSVLLELVVELLLNHPSLAVVTCGALVAYTIWASWVCTTIAFVGADISPWSLSMLYIYFHFYWTSNVFKNILTIVVSGTTMIWYYKDDSSELSPELKNGAESPDLEQGEGSTLFGLHVNLNGTDRKVVGHYLKCALTSSFGSVCIGSLLCPLAHVLWNFLRWARRDESVLTKRFVSLRSEYAESFIRTYHKFSFVHIAAYGKPFYVAAHHSWTLIESRGVEAIVDDDLTSRLLLLGGNGWASVMTAMFITALSGSTHVVFFALACFTLCYTTLSIATQVITAVIKTLFVCFAENPGRLSQLHPLIYHRLVRLSELKSFRDQKSPTNRSGSS